MISKKHKGSRTITDKEGLDKYRKAEHQQQDDSKDILAAETGLRNSKDLILSLSTVHGHDGIDFRWHSSKDGKRTRKGIWLYPAELLKMVELIKRFGLEGTCNYALEENEPIRIAFKESKEVFYEALAQVDEEEYKDYLEWEKDKLARVEKKYEKVRNEKYDRPRKKKLPF